MIKEPTAGVEATVAYDMMEDDDSNHSDVKVRMTFSYLNHIKICMKLGFVSTFSSMADPKG